MKLSEEQKQSLITSLLGFVRRVSFQGGAMPGEVEILPEIVSFLLGETWLFDGEGAPAFLHEDEAESDESQKSENSGYCDSRDCTRCRCFTCEK